MFERFTESARRVLVLAQEEARLLDHSFIGTEHILLGLIHNDNGTASLVLAELGVSLQAVRERVKETIGLAGSPPTGSPPLTPRSKKVMELSFRESLQLGHTYIGTEHLLLGLVREGEGVGCQVLVMLGIDLAEVRQRVVQQLAGFQGHDPQDDSTLQMAPPVGGRPPASVVMCSFCGLSPPASGQMVSGTNAFICENCIRQWSVRLGARPTIDPLTGNSPTPWDTVTPGEQPADPDSARAEITAVFVNYGEVSEDGQAAIGIEGGGDLGWALKAVRANRQQFLEAEIVFTVDEIVFVDPEHAAVWYSISVNGSQVLGRHRGDAVVVEGEWNMSRETFRDLLAQGGITLPLSNPAGPVCLST